MVSRSVYDCNYFHWKGFGDSMHDSLCDQTEENDRVRFDDICNKNKADHVMETLMN